MEKKYFASMDFASLYPSSMKIYDEKFFNEWKRIRNQELRRKKLQQINKLSEI